MDTWIERFAEAALAATGDAARTFREIMQAVQVHHDGDTFVRAKCIEAATEIDRRKKLRIYLEPIVDLEPFTLLPELIDLDLDGIGQAANLEPLSKMTWLRHLKFSPHATQANPLEKAIDVTPLAGLTELTELRVGGTLLTSAAFVTKMTKLTTLGLPAQNLVDLSPISGLIELEDLDLMRNRITDLAPLENLTKLHTLDLRENQIVDITPIAKLPALACLWLGQNAIASIASLERSLDVLSLEHNRITDVSPLARQMKLRRLTLEGNPISDWSPIAGLNPQTKDYKKPRAKKAKTKT